MLVGRQTKGTSDNATHPGVLLLTKVRDSGVLELQGGDGVRICEQIKNVAHCPVPVLDPTVDASRIERVDPIHCRECGRRGDEERMVLCDVCNEGYHIWCLTPSLDRVPAGGWTCRRHGVG